MTARHFATAIEPIRAAVEMTEVKEKMMVEEIVAKLTSTERRYVLATPLQQPADAGIIAYMAGDRNGGHLFASFARRAASLFQRSRNCYNTALEYRLSPLGQQVRDALNA